jgi:hypothetical protein
MIIGDIYGESEYSKRVKKIKNHCAQRYEGKYDDFKHVIKEYFDTYVHPFFDDLPDNLNNQYYVALFRATTTTTNDIDRVLDELFAKGKKEDLDFSNYLQQDKVKPRFFIKYINFISTGADIEGFNKFAACREGRFEANVTALKNYICNNSPLTDLPGYYQDMLVALEFSSHMEAALKALENKFVKQEANMKSYYENNQEQLEEDLYNLCFIWEGLLNNLVFEDRIEELKKERLDKKNNPIDAIDNFDETLFFEEEVSNENFTQNIIEEINIDHNNIIHEHNK